MIPTEQPFPRQLLVGLDAMEWELVERWAREGKLPTFHLLMEQGVRARLATTAAQLPDTVWSALYTGSNPARYEKYFYVQYDATTQWLRHIADDEITRPPFWDYLSQAGRRVGIVDVPKFALSKSLNGFQLTNWGAHATKTDQASTPPSLLNEVLKRFGKHPVGACDAIDDDPRLLRRLRRNILDGVRLHGELFRHLMREQSWDIFFAGFSAPHCVGHHFWRFMDTSHPRHNEPGGEDLRDTIEQVYRAIDRELGEMIALAGSDVQCMVFATHGMGPVYHGSWSLPEILGLLGYGKKEARKSTAGQDVRKAHVNPWRIIKMTVPGVLQYRIKEMLPQRMQDWLLFRWYSGGLNWKGHRAFAVPSNDIVGAIRVSVKGRDLYGLVEPGEPYRRVCQDIADALNELTDPVSGRSVIRKITLTHDEFSGPFLDQLPDITVLWENSFAWDTLHSPRFGTLRLRRQDSRTGGHSDHGFLLATGAGIPAGMELTGCSVYDIAPTVLKTAGVEVPADLDGHPLPVHSLARLI